LRAFRCFWTLFSADGRKAYCKPCTAERGREFKDRNPERVREYGRISRLRKKFGLTLDDFDAMLTSQGGRCAICPVTEPGGVGTWAVDHCHKTGRVRGILCNRCNRGIGRFGDDPARLRAAAAYLMQHRC
jgi:hypothetical protein